MPRAALRVNRREHDVAVFSDGAGSIARDLLLPSDIRGATGRAGNGNTKPEDKTHRGHVVVFLALLLLLTLLHFPARYSPYHTLSPRFLATVKDEQEEAPSCRCRHGSGGGVVIREPCHPSLSRQL